MTDNLLSPTHRPDPSINSSGAFSPVDTRVRRHWLSVEPNVYKIHFLIQLNGLVTIKKYKT